VPSGTPTVSTPSICWDFTGTTAGESIYGAGNTKGPIATPTRVNGVFAIIDCTNWDGGAFVDVVACPGTITKVTIKLDVDVGAGTRTFTLVKNGTAQNGTSGTPDTRITFATGTTKASATFSLAVGAGDSVAWQAVLASGSPATVRPIFGVRLVATTAGQSQYGSAGTVAIGTGTTTTYHVPGQGRDTAGDVTESLRAVTLGLTGFVLRQLQARVTVTPTGGSMAFTARQNSVSGPTTATITAPALSSSSTAATTYAAGDRIALEVVGTTVGVARVPNWACIQDQGAAAAVETIDTYVWGPV
jgi:hypothetical protein